MLFVLYKNSGCYSGRALRRELAKQYKGTVVGGFPNRLNLFLKKKKEPEVIINLGTTESYNINSTFLNSNEMVRAASHKKRARQLFEEFEVPAPKLFLNTAQIQQEDLPVVGRTSYHTKGQGFWFCKTKEQVRAASAAGATHFMKFIPDTREYRVHTFIDGEALGDLEDREIEDYKSVKISEKVWQSESVPDKNTPQKNHEYGWTFLGPQNRRQEELDVVRYAAKKAIAALKMDFGAVDVMYQIKTKKPFVLEVNSTPSLADEQSDTCSRYASRILKTLNKQEQFVEQD